MFTIVGLTSLYCNLSVLSSLISSLFPLKLDTLRDLLNQVYYVVAEVKGNTGEHWVAIDRIQGNDVIMMDPGSTGTNLWKTYNWRNTSTYIYYRVIWEKV